MGIDPNTFNIDPKKIEAAITPKTSAIMPVHCYSNPCDVEAIEAIADKHGLKVIYDAAHAFGVNYKGQSLLNYGDLSILSFHATKVFNTFEGGAVISPDAETKLQIDRLKNFGIEDELTVTAVGINGKMSEINAAFGLVQLKHITQAIEQRKVIDHHYRGKLAEIEGISVPMLSKDSNSNYSYFPILIESSYGLTRDELYGKLKQNNILSRRYFYPLISNMSMYKGMASASVDHLPYANEISNRVLCIPIFNEMEMNDVNLVIDLIRNI